MITHKFGDERVECAILVYNLVIGILGEYFVTFEIEKVFVAVNDPSSTKVLIEFHRVCSVKPARADIVETAEGSVDH